MKTTHTTRIFWAVLFAGAVVWVLYVVALYVTRRTYDEAVTARATLEATLTHQENLRKIKSVLSSTSADRSTLMSAFVNQDNPVEFIKALESIRNMTGVSMTIHSVEVQPSKKGGLFGTATVVGEIAGSWSAVTTYISLLETMPRATRLTALTLEQQGEKAKTPVWQANFSLNAITYQEVLATSTSQ